MSDLIKRLEQKAMMIALGEKIQYWSDSEIMHEVIGEIELLESEIATIHHVAREHQTNLILTKEELTDARRTSEYWKAESLTCNKINTTLIQSLSDIKAWVDTYTTPCHPVSIIAERAIFNSRKEEV